MRVVDLTGKQFGDLYVVSRNGSVDGFAAWLCDCKCGNRAVVKGVSLRRGTTKSCGCAVVKHLRSINQTHGLSGSPTHKTWLKMRERCENPNDIGFKLYGGRGIKVCDRWASFQNFLDDMGIRPEGMTLDRVDVDGDYTPENCRWATTLEQSRNRKFCRGVYDYEGEKHTASSLAKKLHIGWATAKRLLEMVV